MTNINDLNQKLDDLFTEMELDPSPKNEGNRPVSWTWKCDPQGYYTACSPEVKAILGIDPDDFLGQPLSSHKLTPQSSRKLEVVLGTLANDDQLTIQFRNHAGFAIPIRMNIFLSKVEDGSEWVLHGLNQILSRG
jgi:PAS domain-containing protein